MSMPPHEWHMQRAQERLEAAKFLLREGFISDGVSRLYYAAFEAARAVLEALQIAPIPRTHTGVHHLFYNHVVHKCEWPGDLADPLDQTDRIAADYAGFDDPNFDPESAIEHTERFIAAVQKEIDRTLSVSDQARHSIHDDR